MLSFLTKLFAKAPAKTTVAAAPVGGHTDFNAMMPKVEVVHLSLSAILARLPEDLKLLVKNPPLEGATVALPLPTIIKQLPSGGVKISLASLHRQAPSGIFGALPPGDKRLVEVPLAEIFRHVSPSLLKRRSDQRSCEAPAEDLSLFGNTPNPYELMPQATAAPAPPAQPLQVAAGSQAETRPPRLILAGESAPPRATAMILPGSRGIEELPAGATAPRPSLRPTAEFAAAMTRIETAPPPAGPAINQGPSLAVPLAPLIGQWPEEIRNELAALNGSGTVNLPASEVTAGLAKGKVTFTWGQIRSWTVPELAGSSQADESIVLIMPLKVVAPVFLNATKRAKAQPRPQEVDESIPTLFNSEHAPLAKIAAAVEQTPIELTAAPLVEANTEAVPLENLVVELPALAAPAAEAAEGAPEPPPHISLPVDLQHTAVASESIGQILGHPEKVQWTPGEMVEALAKLPGVAGAVVALQEGLLVAEALSPELKGEAFAAFLPQIFARLNQYAAEMQLGEVDDLLFTTKGAHCQIFRLGFIYFAVLGKPGEALPWPELRMVADELTRQTQKTEREY